MEKPGNIATLHSAVPFQEYPKLVGSVQVSNAAEEQAARAAQAKKPAPLSKADLELGKLKAFLMENFKRETGDETPVDCAIRLLTKKK
jgi:hypothetical protein